MENTEELKEENKLPGILPVSNRLVGIFYVFPSSKFSQGPFLFLIYSVSLFHLIIPIMLPIFHDAYVTSLCPVLFLG